MYDPANRRLGMREADTNVAMFGFYIWNNVRIGFQTFAGGLLAGVGSAWFLGANGVIIGAVAGYLTAGRLSARPSGRSSPATRRSSCSPSCSRAPPGCSLGLAVDRARQPQPQEPR